MKVCFSIETQIVTVFAAMLLCTAFLNVKANDYVSNVVVVPVFEQKNVQVIDAKRKRREQIITLYCYENAIVVPICN